MTAPVHPHRIGRPAPARRSRRRPAPGQGTWSPSPDPRGRRVACVSDRGGAPRAWLHTRGGGAPVVLETGPEPVVRVAWAPDGRWIACVLAPGGAPRTEVWLIRPDGTGLHRAAGQGATGALLAGWTDAGELAVTEVDAESRAVLVAPDSGDRRVLATDPVLALLDVAPDGATALLRCGPRGARRLEVVDIGSGVRRRLLSDADAGRFSADGRHVYARSDLGADLPALVSAPVAGGDPVPIARRPDAELEDFALTADRRGAALLWNRYGGVSELTLLDPASHEQRPVPPPAGEVFEAPVFSADGGTLCFVAEGPVRPRAVWSLNVRTSQLARVGPAGPTRTGVAPQLCDVHAPDGLTISGWLYRPEGTGPWPTVISLHGGPEAQERPGHNPLFQELVAHGVAVFAPNVRGSSGFGRSYLAADNLAGRYAAIADVAACAEYVVAAGVATPGRIGCMGRSYGGYLTLTALVTFPELFAAGISECGMSNFETFYARTEPWIAAAAVSKYGCPERDRDLLRDLSPVHRLDRLTAPLLLIHGANDTNVPVYESEQVVAALRDRPVPHALLMLDGEGHDFLARTNRETARAATVGWLTTYL